ncbi:MAG: macrolide family glycosyltransferase, partial [Pseudonocardiaceae bacterium]
MHITFLVTPGHGHLNPTLGVVAELIRRGHRVTYPVPEEFVDAIRAVGAEPVRYESPLQRISGPPRKLTGSFFADFQLRLLEVSMAITPALEGYLAGELPDVISYDIMGPFAARVLGFAWGRRLIATAPSLVFNEHFSPWGAFDKRTMSAEDDPVINEFRERFIRFAAEYGVPRERMKAMGTAFTTHDEPVIVFVPEWFQPAADTFEDRYVFTGPCLTGRAAQDGWQPSGSGPVLLISLGTAFNDRPELFRTCAGAFAGTPWQVVMSIGHRIDPAALGPLPGNVAAHPHVPQLSILRQARAFISHAGMGSTMEALYHGVPLLAVPQMPEQQLNAERVAELGLGRMLRPEQVNAEAIRTAVG